MLPAARQGDFYECPVCGKGVISTGLPTVKIEGMPAARATDACICVTSAPDTIMDGEISVNIGGLPAARTSSVTVTHGAIISPRPAKTFIGTNAGGGAGAADENCLSSAGGSGTPFVNVSG